MISILNFGFCEVLVCFLEDLRVVDFLEVLRLVNLCDFLRTTMYINKKTNICILLFKSKINYNLPVSDLTKISVSSNLGQLTNDGVLSVNTGRFTGRSPKDRFIVCDEKTENSVWWGDINKKFDADKFDRLYDRVTAYLTNRDVFVRDNAPGFKLNLK